MLCYGANNGCLSVFVAAVASRLCNSITSWDYLQPLVASSLITLDKCTGMRLIGIGETLCQVIGKAVCMLTTLDIEVVCRSDQFFAGFQSEIGGVIHIVRFI